MKTERFHHERQQTLEKMGTISVQASGVQVEKKTKPNQVLLGQLECRSITLRVTSLLFKGKLFYIVSFWFV